MAIDRNTIVFIGGHHLYKLPDGEGIGFDNKLEYVPLITPFNDLVYKYNFMERKWTKFPKVPNVKVDIIITIYL